MKYQQNQGLFTISQSQNVTIHESDYSKNQAQNGGAIQFKSIQKQINFTQCMLQNNIAYSSGGALYFENIGSTQIQFDSQTQIKNNKALIGGGIRIVQTNSSSLIIPQGFPFEKNIFQNNASIYGDNSATYLQKIFVKNTNTQTNENNYIFQIQNNTDMIPQEYQHQYQFLVDINQFQSGGQLKIQFQIVDNYNRHLSFNLQALVSSSYPKDIQDELKSIQIIINNLNSSQTELIGERILNYNQYNDKNFTFELTGLQVQGVLKSKQFLSIDSSIYSNSLIKLPILLSIYFRQCFFGEIIQQQVNQIFICKSCQYGTYSLVDPNLLFQQSQNISLGVKNECKNCPTSAIECQGSIISLKNGYWRQNNFTDEIVECNPQIRSCQAEDPSSINLCSIGYFGPICQECDNLGNVWKGNRYSESSKKGECQECYSLSFQWIYFLLKVIVMITYFIFTTFVFISQFKYTQSCYYIRRMMLLPISKSQINDYSGFYIKIIINYCQLSSLLLPQPQILQININILNIFLGQTCRYLSLGLDCMFNADTIKQLGKIMFFSLSQFLTIILVLFLTLATFKLIKYFLMVNMYHLATFLHVFIIFFQIGQISYFSKSLTCTQIGSQLLNPYDLNVQCNDPNTVKFLFSYSIIMLLFWTLLPIVFLLRIIQRKAKLDQCKTKYFYGYYYGELKNKHFYWEFIRIYLKITLIYINTLLNQNSQITINSILIIIGIYITTLRKVNPFISQNIQSSEVQAYSLLIAKIYLNSINQDSYESKILVEILVVLIDYIFFSICGFTILVYKSRQGTNLSSKLIRSLFKLFLTKNYYDKQIINSKTSLKTFQRWKLVQKNLMKIISQKVTQNINIITSRSNFILNSQQSEFQQHIVLTEQQKGKKFSQYSPQILSNQSTFKQKQFISNKKTYNWNTDEGNFNIMSDFVLKSDEVLNEQDPSKVQKYCISPKSLTSKTKQSILSND